MARPPPNKANLKPAPGRLSPLTLGGLVLGGPVEAVFAFTSGRDLATSTGRLLASR
jgi:hypothetical protein